MTSIKKAYLSESGHAFCPECDALLKFLHLRARVTSCAHCEATIAVELDVASYATPERGAFERLTQGRGGLVGAALGMSLSIMACDRAAAPADLPATSTPATIEASPEEHDAGDPAASKPPAPPAEAPDMAAAVDLAVEDMSVVVSPPEQQDLRPPAIYGDPAFFNEPPPELEIPDPEPKGK